jgi:uncharacterized protein YndB with AHSA1/START domain
VNRAPDRQEFAFHGEYREVDRPHRLVITSVYEGAQVHEAPDAVTFGQSGAMLSLIFFCWPLGIPAIVYANRVNEKRAAGDQAGAQSASRSAQDFATWATVVGSILYFIIIMMIAAAAGSPL